MFSVTFKYLACLFFKTSMSSPLWARAIFAASLAWSRSWNEDWVDSIWSLKLHPPETEDTTRRQGMMERRTHEPDILTSESVCVGVSAELWWVRWGWGGSLRCCDLAPSVLALARTNAHWSNATCAELDWVAPVSTALTLHWTTTAYNSNTKPRTLDNYSSTRMQWRH